MLPDFIDTGLMIRFAINVIATTLLVFGLFYVRYRDKELVTAASLFNIFAFGVLSILGAVEFSLAAGFGLFAILALFTLRSDGTRASSELGLGPGGRPAHEWRRCDDQPDPSQAGGWASQHHDDQELRLQTRHLRIGSPAVAQPTGDFQDFWAQVGKGRGQEFRSPSHAASRFDNMT
jgi:hypothetical protein